MKFGVREICDVVLKAKSQTKIGSHTFLAGEPVVYFDTAKTSSMESAATTVYATGGKGNSRLIAWEGEKTLTFTMEDALISPKGLAILSGADLISPKEAANSVIVSHVTEQVLVETAKTINVPLPAGASDLVMDEGAAYVMLLDVNGEMSTVPVKSTITKSGEKYVISCDQAKVGDAFLVDYYAKYVADAQQIDITPDKFGGFYYLEASTLFRREADGKDLPAEFVIPKVKVQSNFTFSMASSGDPSSFTFTMDAFPDYTKWDPTKKVLASIQIIGADDNADLVSSDDEAAVTYERYTQYESVASDYITSDGKAKTTDTEVE